MKYQNFEFIFLHFLLQMCYFLDLILCSLAETTHFEWFQARIEQKYQICHFSGNRGALAKNGLLFLKTS